MGYLGFTPVQYGLTVCAPAAMDGGRHLWKEDSHGGTETKDVESKSEI